jgi:hypothetical protein
MVIDLIIKIAPNITKIGIGSLTPAPNIKINPLMKSIPPSNLTDMFFKLNYYLKTYLAPVAQPGLEHFRPKERVAGSNPVGRVNFPKQ